MKKLQETTMLRSLRHRNFRLFFSGQLISLVGTWMQSVAQSWLIYRLTDSALLLGLTTFLGQIPGLVIAPIGGVVADRHSRHKIVIITQTCSMILALILAGLTLSGVVQIWHILTLAALMGIVNAFDMPARQSFVVEMVGRDDMGNAIALNSSMVNGARIIGPAVAGILVSMVGEGWCFFLNGLSYIAVIVGLLMMRLELRAHVKPTTSALAHIKEGFRFVLGEPPILALLLLLGVVSLMGMPYTVLMPIFADKILKGGSGAMGLLMGLSGAGALVGALTLTMKKELRGLGRWIAIACVGFGISLIAFSFSRFLWLSCVLIVPLGLCMMVQMAASNTLIQAMVPDRLRGRVMSVYSMMFIGMAPFGALFAGALAKPLGAPVTVAIGGLACACAGGLFWTKLPLLRGRASTLLSSELTAET